MTDSSWLNLLKKERAIAVIRAPEFELGFLMAKAVAQGGMGLIEITWNSDRAPELIEKLRVQFPHCQIGTGTLFNQKELQDAINCGAQFLFTPHTNLEMIKLAVKQEIPIIPGALSPTEIITAWQGGATCVKVFPISAVGGVNYIKSLQGPLGQIPLIPTGGVTLENAKDFIKEGAIGVGLAGDLFPKTLMEKRDWDAIETLAKTLKQDLQ